MTFMPKFIQSGAGVSHDYQMNTEAELLEGLCRTSLSRLLNKLDNPASRIYSARLEAELNILEQNDYCGYFLIVADYVQWAKKKGIAVGPGRGSGPCSLVGFLMDITKIDPIAHNLPFERFVNPDRDRLPDFDLDFCAARRNEVSNYIQSKYGPDRVAFISSNETSPLPSRLVISDRPLTELAAVYTDAESGFSVAKMTTEQIADAGLVQFNVINQRALTVIQRTIQNLEKVGTELDIDHIPLDDTPTYQLLGTGESSNIALLDDQHYKATLRTVQPDRFEDLSAVVALCQPYLRNHIPLFVERQRIPAARHSVHPAIKHITAETYGLVIYQEQLMHIAHAISGFTLAQGDLLRRALKSNSHEMIEAYRSEFTKGSIKNGFSTAESAQIFNHLQISGSCYFNKSHAVAYATIAYQMAWLKANYPNEFAMAESK